MSGIYICIIQQQVFQLNRRFNALVRSVYNYQHIICTLLDRTSCDLNMTSKQQFYTLSRT